MKHPYEELKENLAQGWNTWNTRSVLSHVLLPEAFAVNLSVKEYQGGEYLRDALVTKPEERPERVFPKAHAYDGSYTELRLTWKKIDWTVQSASKGGELFLLVTPHSMPVKPGALIVEAGVLWNREGYTRREGECLIGVFPKREIHVYATKRRDDREVNVPCQSPFLALTVDQPVGICTGKQRSLAEVQAVISEQKQQHEKTKESYGELAELYHAMQTCMGWDTIYEPEGNRVISTVSRLWNIWRGGWALFCWDTYFAGLMAAMGSKEIAYANVIEETIHSKTSNGFVPNSAEASGLYTLDRSQPCVGSMTVLMLYHKFKDKWLPELLFDDLFVWNTWFFNHRRTPDDYMCWGSNPYEQVTGNYWEYTGVNGHFGAALESGLDNSPMFDGAAFNKETHLMELADVGLMSLYIADCKALGELAVLLGKNEEGAVLEQRAKRIDDALQTLWDEEFGLFLNKKTDTGELYRRISPTNFYPLLSQTATQRQAEIMMEKHFYNPDEFWGDWILPSISKDDPLFPEQDYWRGRIWAPLNFLVYLGLCKYDLPQARHDLAEKSAKLILKEWMECGHVHENYSPYDGSGCGINSDAFYHWGGLLSLIGLMEGGYFGKEDRP